MAKINRRHAVIGAGVASAAAAAAPQSTAQPPPQPNPLRIWHAAPATEWVEATPIGNGRLGAMLFGGVSNERIQLNEDTFYAGGPYNPVNPEARAALPEVRRLIFEGRYEDAHKLAETAMMARPLRQMPFQTAGDLLILFPILENVRDYARELDLDTALCRTSFAFNQATIVRECFASAPDQVLAMRCSADRPRQFTAQFSVSTPERATVSVEDGDTLVLAGTGPDWDGVPGALRFETRVKLLCRGGSVRAHGQSIYVDSADEIVILVSAATSYRNFADVSADPAALNRARIAAAAAQGYETLRARHVEEYQRLFRRVRFDLGQTEAAALPTDQRIQHFAGANDPALAALYFQFARYLLISSSRPTTQPANLQGIWNDRLDPPWGCKFTININTEMNYWPAGPANLLECVEPLTAMVEDLAVTGARTARDMYGARGWVAHHNTDLWRATAPVDGPGWGLWPTGGAWLCQNLWDAYEYDPDPAFLARIYPLLKGASEFFLDALVEHPARGGALVTNPSLSPENWHPYGTSLCAGPAMDNQILRDLFGRAARASELLNKDADFRAEALAARARLAPDKVGKAGQLQEWWDDWDMEAPEIHHRHVSHLYALYPSEQITLDDTPELAAAARRSLEIRGDEATGWGVGWRINLWARLRQGDHAHELIKFLLSPQRTYPNLFDAHPPFQIDGNFGGAAGMAELLLQSHRGRIHLLPALPSAWPSGAVTGLRARGGFEVDLSWSEATLSQCTLRSRRGGEANIVYAGQALRLRLPRGRSARLRLRDGALTRA